MADRGYREVITYSFVDPSLQQQLFPGMPSLRLANPISADLSAMRVSLWTGLVHTCRENLRRQQHRVRLFEIGNKFQMQGEDQAQRAARNRNACRHRDRDALAGAVGRMRRRRWTSTM